MLLQLILVLSVNENLLQNLVNSPYYFKFYCLLFLIFIFSLVNPDDTASPDLRRPRITKERMTEENSSISEFHLSPSIASNSI